MKFKKANARNTEVAQLVRSLLKIDPAELRSLGIKSGIGGDRLEAGLHEFMRIVLETALSLLCTPADYQIPLRTDAAKGARLHNLIQIFGYALIREPRAKRGLPELAMYEADPKVVYLPRPQGRKDRMPLSELLPLAAVLLDSDFDAIRDAAGPNRTSFSMCDRLTESLGVPPHALIRIYYSSQQDAELAASLDRDGQALAGIAACLLRTIRNLPLILSQGIDIIRFPLLKDELCNEAGGGFAAFNFASLLMFACLADGKRDVAFLG